MFISLDEKKLTDDTFKVFSDYIESICRENEMREDETIQKILDRIQTPSFVRGKYFIFRILFILLGKYIIFRV